MAERAKQQPPQTEAQAQVKRVLQAGADDGEEGQANGVLQHYAYRCVRVCVRALHA